MLLNRSRTGGQYAGFLNDRAFKQIFKKKVRADRRAYCSLVTATNVSAETALLNAETPTLALSIYNQIVDRLGDFAQPTGYKPTKCFNSPWFDAECYLAKKLLRQLFHK